MSRKKQNLRETVQKPEPGVKLLLNGGKEEMDAATIPIRWFFTKRVLAQNPEWVLILEQGEEESRVPNNRATGRRYAFKVEEVEAFIQIFTSGWHRFGVIVLEKSELNQEAIGDFLETGRGCYERTISLVNLDDEYKCINIASTIVEFSVPAGVFAQKPKTWIGQLIWRIVNERMYRSDPVDECDYRKRRIYAVPYFLLLWPIGIFFKYLIGSIYALLVLIWGLWWAFWGWRPKNILTEMWDAFLWRRDEVEMRVHPGEWRVWGHDDWKKTKWPMPYEIVGAYLLIRTTARHLDIMLAIILSAGFVVMGYFLLRFFLSLTAKRRRKVAKMRLLKDKQKEKARKKWLRENFSTANMPGSVDLGNLPKPLDKGARAIHSFRVSYWTAKMRVCKPYSRE